MNVSRVFTAAALVFSLSLGGMGVPSQAWAAPASDASAETSSDPAESEGDDPESEGSPASETEGEDSEDSEEPEDTSLEEALREEAYHRYLEGKRLFEDRRYLDAAAAFERSYAAVSMGRSLYALALSYEKAGEVVKAFDAYQRYVALPDCPAPRENCAARRSEVRRTLSELKGQVGVLTILVDEGVQLRGVEVEGRIIPPEDFPLVLEPGRFELRIRGRKRGQVRQRVVEIEAGQRTSIVISGFEKPPGPAVTPERRADDGDSQPNPRRITEEERRRRLEIAFYSGVGLTALSGIGVGVAGGLTLRAYNAQKDRCRGEGMNCAGTEFPAEERDRVENLRPVTNALIGVTAGLAITTVVVGLFAFSRESGTAGTRATRVAPRPGGLSFRF